MMPLEKQGVAYDELLKEIGLYGHRRVRPCGDRDRRPRRALTGLQPLLEARPKPWVLDDALINRSKRVNGEALQWCGVYDRQLTRWLSQHLTPAQRREVTRLQGVQRNQRRVLNELLALLDELAANTIDRQLAKSDIQLGLEYVLGLGPPLPARRPPTT